MELNYFDLIAGIIILLLGLKGIINGLFKEVFGLVGIVGGIFIASRIGNDVGLYLSNLIFKFDNSAAINFTGFLATLAVFWLIMLVVGTIFQKLSVMSGLGPVDKILGFVFGASKFFLIASVIAYATYNIKAMRSSIDSYMNNSVLFPILVESGSYIMKLEPVEMSDDIGKKIGIDKDKMQDQIKDALENSSQKFVEKTKEEIKKNVDKLTDTETK